MESNESVKELMEGSVYGWQTQFGGYKLYKCMKLAKL